MCPVIERGKEKKSAEYSGRHTKQPLAAGVGDVPQLQREEMDDTRAQHGAHVAVKEAHISLFR